MRENRRITTRETADSLSVSKGTVDTSSWTFAIQQGLCTMGPKTSHWGPEVSANGCLLPAFTALPHRGKQLSFPDCGLRRNLVPFLRSGNETNEYGMVTYVRSAERKFHAWSQACLKNSLQFWEDFQRREGGEGRRNGSKSYFIYGCLDFKFTSICTSQSYRKCLWCWLYNTLFFCVRL